MPRARITRRRVRKIPKKAATPSRSAAPALHVRNEADVKKALDILKNHPLTVVLVFANWCPHCHSYMPTWKKLEKTPNRSAPMIAVEQANAEPILNAMGANVEGYPTVFAATKNGSNGPTPNVGEPIANPREEDTMKNLLVNGAPSLGNQPIPNGNMGKASATESATKVPSRITTMSMENSANAATATATPPAISNEPTTLPTTLPTVSNSIKAANTISARSRTMADRMLNSGFAMPTSQVPADVDLATPPPKESKRASTTVGGNPAAAATSTLFDALSTYSAGSAISKAASIAGLLGTYHLVSRPGRKTKRSRSRSRR